MDNNKWNARHDAFRPSTGFTDLLKIIASYYEMYSKASVFLGPWIAKHRGTMFLVPTREQIQDALGKDRPTISYRARSAFIDSLISFLAKSKGNKTLITPSPSSHHSAQFPAGTFKITQVDENKVSLRDDKAKRKPSKNVYMIELAGADEPIYIENLNIPANKINFLILRPKLGKLGTASVTRWEVLLYNAPHGYLVDHVDSELNPRFSGIF